MPMYGTNGQFGGGYQNPQYGKTPWEQSWWTPPDFTAAMQGAQNDITRGANSQFLKAAQYLGNSGMQGGTPWSGTMGGIATDASRQMAEVGNRYAYEAQQQEANRRLQAQQGAANSWGQGQQRQHEMNLAQGGWNQQNMQDYWNRQYDAALRGGSNDWMNQWQTAQTPWAQQYAQSFRNW